MPTKYRLRPSQVGKTADMVKWAAETGGLVVCATQEQADRVAALAKRLGVEIVKPVVAAPPAVDVSVLPQVDYDLPPLGQRTADFFDRWFRGRAR